MSNVSNIVFMVVMIERCKSINYKYQLYEKRMNVFGSDELAMVYVITQFWVIPQNLLFFKINK